MHVSHIQKYPWIAVGAVALVLVGLFVAIDLWNRGTVQNAQPKLEVAATIFPVYDLVRSVAKDKVSVKLLLPEGESPRTLPNLYTGVYLKNTQRIFAIGLGYDTEGLPSEDVGKLVTLDRGIDVLLEQGSTGSPYYWLSVPNAKKMLATILDELIRLDPGSAEYFRENARTASEQLDALDTQIRELLGTVTTKQMVVYGYDWGYFAREYGLSIVEFEPGDTITSSRVEELRAMLSDYRLTALFTDITVSPDPFLPAMSQQYLRLYHLDVYGGVEDRTSYTTTMAYNARSIYEGLTDAP